MQILIPPSTCCIYCHFEALDNLTAFFDALTFEDSVNQALNDAVALLDQGNSPEVTLDLLARIYPTPVIKEVTLYLRPTP